MAVIVGQTMGISGLLLGALVMAAACAADDGTTLFTSRGGAGGAGGAGGGDVTGGAGGSSGGGMVCVPGDTRECVGPGACEGGQRCATDGTWGECDCGVPGGTGGGAGASGSGGQSGGAGGSSGGSGLGGTSGLAGSGGLAGSSGQSGGAGQSGSSGTSGTGGTGGTGGIGGACPSEPAHLAPVKMVFMVDRSGSMGDDQSTVPPMWANYESRWVPMRDGILAFMNEPVSGRIYASMDTFAADGGIDVVCDPVQYQPPYVTVPMTSLESNAVFVAALNTITPQGGTPTWPAMRGALDYAVNLQQEDAQARVVVVLITDGQPGISVPPVDDPYGAVTMREACLEYGITPVANTIGEISAIVDAAHQQDGILTYVIGITSEASSLVVMHTIASAGGTNEVTLITTTDPATTTQAVQDRLSAIRTEHLSCGVPIPQPPVGQEFDPQLINVTLTIDGSPLELDQAVGCPGGLGWEYDNEAAPTRIELCDATCATVQGSAWVEISVEFGCATRVH